MPSAKRLRTLRAQAVVAESGALVLCQATAAGARDLAEARRRARGAGAGQIMVVGSATLRARVATQWQVPPLSGTLLVAAVAQAEQAPALWTALAGLPRVVPQGVATPTRWWTHRDLAQWAASTPAAWGALARQLASPGHGVASVLAGGSRPLPDVLSRALQDLVRLLGAHSSAG